MTNMPPIAGPEVLHEGVDGDGPYIDLPCRPWIRPRVVRYSGVDWAFAGAINRPWRDPAWVDRYRMDFPPEGDS